MRTLRRRSGLAASFRLKCSCRNLALYACMGLCGVGGQMCVCVCDISLPAWVCVQH